MKNQENTVTIGLELYNRLRDFKEQMEEKCATIAIESYRGCGNWYDKILYFKGDQKMENIVKIKAKLDDQAMNGWKEKEALKEELRKSRWDYGMLNSQNVCLQRQVDDNENKYHLITLLVAIAASFIAGIGCHQIFSSICK